MAWTPHKEGDAVTLATVNANISALEAQANLASADAIAFKSLGEQHLPSILGETASKVVYGTEQDYTNSAPSYGIDTMDPVSGWQVIANSAHGDLEVSLVGVDLTKNKVLVMANINIKNVAHATDGLATMTAAHATVKIQVKDGSGNWMGLSRTERYMQKKSTQTSSSASVDPADIPFTDAETKVRHGDIPIRTLVDSNDVAVLTGVRVVIGLTYSVFAREYGVSGVVIADGKVTVMHCNLSAITFKQAI